MHFIILPLTQPDKKRKQGLIENTVALAKQVDDDTQQAFILAGILTATNKFIDPEYSKKVKEWLKMTKVARLLIEEAVEEALEERDIDIANKLIKQGFSINAIVEAIGLPEAKVMELQTKFEQSLDPALV